MFKMPVGHIMLDGPQYNFELFASQFQTTWNRRIGFYRDGNFYGFISDGMVVGCALVPTPVPDPALKEIAKESVMWSLAEHNVAKHTVHLMVTLDREKGPVASHSLLSKVIYSMLHQRNVMGVYFKPGLFEPDYYIKCAEALLSGKLPTELWVHINSYGFDKSGSSTFFTYGMTKFGKKEFEIIDTKNNFVDTYYLLKDLIKRTIAEDIDFKNGDFTGPEGGAKIPLTVSKGKNIKGETIKIGVLN